MSKVNDSNIESNSWYNPSKLVPQSFETLASLNDEDSDSEGNVQQQSFSNS